MLHRLNGLTRYRSHLSRFIILAIAAALTFGLSVFLSSRSISPAAMSITLSSVSDESLRSIGITLLPPPPGSREAAVPKSVAEQVAVRVQPGVTIREVVLARVVDEGGIDTLAWVVSLDPAFLPISHAGVHVVARFLLVFVDAESGRFLRVGVSDSTPISDAQTPVALKNLQQLLDAWDKTGSSRP